ncbi:MAG: autotransporter-associated beta strand repeat-containing protein [Verrucomicrobiales bacterium]|nr:autotransporter-associated beta strand repeat-containing protein [Verrucomicrobiales bacterium]
MKNPTKTLPLSYAALRSAFLQAALLAVLSVGVPEAGAATRIWTGGHASSAHWNQRNNWGGSGVPTHGDTLVFPSGAARLLNTNNIPGLRLHEIQFLGLGGGYNLRGSGISVTNGIAVAADAVNTLSLESVTFSGPQALSVSTGGQLTVNSDLVLSSATLHLAAAGDMSLRGVLSGKGDVVKTGAGLVTFFGEKDNTYRGTTFVNGGTLALYQRETTSLVPLTIISRVAIPGNLVVGDGTNAAVARLNFDDQIADAATVTVRDGSSLKLFANTDTISDLVLQGGEVSMTTGRLALDGDLTSRASASSAILEGFLLLNAASTFHIEDGKATQDLQIPARIGSSGGWGFTKTGPGTLRLSGTNTYHGATFINEGDVRVATDAAFGQPFNGTTIASGAELIIETAVETLPEPLTIAGAGVGGFSGAIRIGSGATLSTNLTLSAPATINTLLGGNLQLEGVISGTGPLTKIGPGTLEIAGKSGNSFSGALAAVDGLTLLSKLAGTAVPGDLIVGTTNSTATVRHTRSANLGGTLRLHAGCLYDLNGYNESIDGLTFVGGGLVETGSGQLTVDTDIQVLAVVDSPSEANRIKGRLRLGNATQAHITVLPELKPPFIYGGNLFIEASVSGPASIIKDGYGYLGLTGSNSFTGSFTLAQGNVGLSDNHALGTAEGDTIVQGDSTLFLNGGLGISSERLVLSATNAVLTLYSGHLVSLGSNSWSGPMFLSKTALLNVPTNGTLNVSGTINGLAGLTKFGAGTLIYSGTRSNTYLGATRVNEGRMILNRTGSDDLSIPGPLIVGDGIGGPEADVVETGAVRPQIDDHAPVSIGYSGLLRIQGIEEIGSLAGSGRIALEADRLIISDSGGTSTFEGMILGPGELVKQGPGTLVLSGVSTYTGDTLIYGGTVTINGSQPGSDVYVAPAATLRGSGFVGSLSVDGTLVPGNPLGRLTAQTVNFLPGSTLVERIEGPPQSGAFTPYGNNWFESHGALDVTGAALELSLGFPPSAGQEFYIGSKLGAVPATGNFNGRPEGAVVMLSGIPFRLSYEGGSGNDITLTVGDLPLRLKSALIEAGNGNGRIEPNECDNLVVTIENPTAANVQVVEAHLQSLDNRILITQGQADFGVVPAMGSNTNRAVFQIRTTPDLPCGENAVFHLILGTVGHGKFAIPIRLPTGTAGPYQEFSSAGGPIVIPDAGVLNSLLPVAPSFKVSRVRVSVHATHPSVGQLRLKLISPQGVQVVLASNQGGAGNNYGQSCERPTRFADGGLVSITTADAPFSGTFAPEGHLNELVGLDSFGAWTLRVEDTVAGVVGSLQCWSLELAPAECSSGGGGCESCHLALAGSLDNSRVLHERILGGYPSGCGDTPFCSGTTSLWHPPFRYTAHRFTNDGPDACVAVLLSVPCTDAARALQGTAYLGEFDPAAPCANLVGSSGDSIAAGSGGFSFQVPAGEHFTVVINEKNTYKDFEGCDTYTLELFGLPCPDQRPVLHIANDAGPEQVRLHWSTAYPGFNLQRRAEFGGLVIGGFTNLTTAPVVVDGEYNVTNRQAGTDAGFFRLRKP